MTKAHQFKGLNDWVEVFRAGTHTDSKGRSCTFTEADLERVITERLSPLNVSIHATDPVVRSRMLKNPRGGMSLRWLRALLDHGDPGLLRRPVDEYVLCHRGYAF